MFNLYISGCSLERHWSNIRADAAEYLYELNGESKERDVSISQALAEEEWDFIVTQQASHDRKKGNIKEKNPPL